MGNWNISIRGVGCHHNEKPFDVEKLTAEFVKTLKDNGHTIASAVVTAGSEIDVTPREPKIAGTQPVEGRDDCG